MVEDAVSMKTSCEADADVVRIDAAGDNEGEVEVPIAGRGGEHGNVGLACIRDFAEPLKIIGPLKIGVNSGIGRRVV